MKILNVLLFSIVSSFVHSQEHLYPETSIYARMQVTHNYHLFVTKAFEAAYANDVILKVITIPSFDSESALFIKKIENQYSLILLEAEIHYWQIYSNNVPVNPIEKCNISIPNQLAIQLEKIWVSELLKTKYSSNNRLGMDGTTYHFSTPRKHDNSIFLAPMAGKTWSPDQGTRMGELVNLIHELKQTCIANGNTNKVKQVVDKLVVK
ncbi:hypothetical protein ACM9HF_04530 [Colwellia sp. RE-S-Sl-9]